MPLSFRTKLLFTYVGLVAGMFLLVFFGLERTLARDLEAQAFERLELQARGVAQWAPGSRHMEKLAGRLAGITGARVSLFGASGSALGDSAFPGDSTPNLLPDPRAPEIEAARAVGLGRSLRMLDGQAMQLVAILADDGVVVRLALPVSQVDAAVHAVRGRVLLATSLGFLGAVIVGLFATRLVASPLRTMMEAARRIGRGEYRDVPRWESRDEFGRLSGSLQDLATQLHARIAELDRADAVRRDFVANVSHELKTPVAAVRGAAETLLGPKPLDAQNQAVFLEVIHRQSLRMGRLVEDLLSLSELSDPDVRRRQEEVGIEDVTHAITSALRTQAEARHMQIVVENVEGLVVLGDRDDIERLLANLVENALKYGSDGGKVVVSGARHDGWVRLAVKDDGPGIALDEQPRIFERFYRTEAGRRATRQGVGLGLALVRRLAESMGGTVSVESQPPHGAAFHVRLPSPASVPERR